MALTLEMGLKSVITGNAPIAALISGRCYPMHLPQSPTLPAITYRRISAPPSRVFGDRAFTTARYQITAWAATIIGAQTLGDALIVLFDDFVGTMSTVNVSGTVLNDIPLFDDETTRAAYVVDVELWY